MSEKKPVAFNYKDYIKAMEENASLQAQLEQVAAGRDEAVKHIPHICEYCILKDGPCEIRDEGGIRCGAYTCGVFEWSGLLREGQNG